jgi:hypothetical protein
MPKHSRYLLALLIAPLIGCATAYGPRGFTGGYWDRRIASDIFQVGFRGNGFTRSEDAYNFALYHAAEVTQEAGYRYFVILDDEQNAAIEQYEAPGDFTGTTSLYGDTATTSGIYTPGAVVTFRKPRASFLIKCFSSNQGSASFDAYDILNTESPTPVNASPAQPSGTYDSSGILHIDHAQP